MSFLWSKYHGYFDNSDIVTDKEKSARSYASYFYVRLLKMFHYEGLPDTIPQDVLEYYLLRNGSCFITEVEADVPENTQVGVEGKSSQLFAFIGTPGERLDAYYRPTKYICNNPYLNVSFEKAMWGDEGIFAINDSMWLGLNPLIQRYSYLMAENLVTMRTADIMLRVIALITAPDDKTKAAADEFLSNIEAGKLGAIGDNPFFSGIQMQSPPSNNGSYLTQFIELHQYYKGSFYNEIGLQANFNMKREAIGVGEAALTQDSLLPLCDDMLEKRREMCEKFGDLYNIKVDVDFSSAWKHLREEIESELVENSQLLKGGEDQENGETDQNPDGIRDNEDSEIDNGEENSGEENSGEENSGEENSGKENSGEENSGEENSGEETTGEEGSEKISSEESTGEDPEESDDGESGEDVIVETVVEKEGESDIEITVEVKGEADETNEEDSGSVDSAKRTVSDDEL